MDIKYESMKIKLKLFAALAIIVASVSAKGQIKVDKVSSEYQDKTNKGVKFENERTWDEIREKAKIEKKSIFIDCFTTWCLPCRKMNFEVFSQAEVGDYMNERFISVKIQLDTTKNDSEKTKEWHAIGKRLMETANINAFPTFLYLDESGNLLHKIVGSFNAKTFLALTDLSLKPENQVYTMVNALKKGQLNGASVKKLINEVQKIDDAKLLREVARMHFSKLDVKDLFIKENILLLAVLTTSSSDMGFDILLRNEDRIDSIAGQPGYVRDQLATVIYGEEAQQYVSEHIAKSNIAPDWRYLRNKIMAKYKAKYADRVIIKAKMEYYAALRIMPKYATCLVVYVERYGKHLLPYSINEYAYQIFKYSQDKLELEKASQWMVTRVALDDAPDIDTYANILYKLKRVKEALKWQEKAMALAPRDEEIKSNYNKMKLGLATWYE